MYIDNQRFILQNIGFPLSPSRSQEDLRKNVSGVDKDFST